MQKCKILIVEDELITRQAMRYIIGLEQQSFEIIGEACNGREAQILIEKGKPDVVISDIVMPVMDGIELTKFIKLRYPNIHVVILSSHSNFEYVKSTFQYGVFDYILKPELEPEGLLNILYKAAKSLNISNILPKKEKEKEAPKYTYPYFCMIGCKLEKIEGYKKKRESFYLEVIVERIKAYLKDVSYESSVTEEGCFIMLLNFDKTVREHIDDSIEAIAEEMYRISTALRVAKTDIFENIQEKDKKIKMIDSILELEFYMPVQQLVLINNPHRKHTVLEFNHKDYYDKLQRGLYREAFQMVTNFLSVVDEKYGIKEQELKKKLENILYNTLNTLEEASFEIEEITSNKLELFNHINKAQNIADLRQCVEDMIHMITKQLDKQRRVENLIMSKMYAYIDEHYNEQITLNTLASVFHLSYSYLSCYFSTSTNKGFNEYLNEVRINRAKELLCYSEISISDISEQVGYADQSYFSKVFKKMTTYSPSEYRRTYSR